MLVRAEAAHNTSPSMENAARQLAIASLAITFIWHQLSRKSYFANKRLVLNSNEILVLPLNSQL